MKKILFIILLFVLSEYSLCQYPQYSGDWRWRNDDGDVYTATWKDSILTPLIINDYENIRLRIELQNYDTDTNRVVLFYTTNRDVWSDYLWSWTRIAVEINDADTGLFYLSNSEYLEDSQTYYDNKMLPGRKNYWPYQKTITIESTNELLVDIDDEKTIELEYCIKPNVRIESGKTYYLMLGTFENPFNSIIPDLNENLPGIIVPPINWKFKPTGLTSHFNSIYKDENNALWITGFDDYHYRGYILKSTDDGYGWRTQWSDSAYEVKNICFYGDYGWATVNFETNLGQILRSTDKGDTWELYSTLYNYEEFYWLKFFDENNGYCLGESSSGYKLYKSTNSGKTWQTYKIKDYFRTEKGFFIDMNTGWFAGTQGDLLKTTDGGLTWINQTDMHSYPDLKSVFFVNDMVGWAVGGSSDANEVVLKTKDGGEHWTPQIYGDAEQELNDLFFLNDQIGWVIGSRGIIRKTTDGGFSWKVQETGTSNSLNSIYFADENTGWVVGENGVILNTINGGTTFIEESEPNFIPEYFTLEQNYPNPFNSSTKIRYSIPSVGTGLALSVTLKIFDVLGNEVATLVDEYKSAGTYEVEFNPASSIRHPASGIYFYQLKAGDPANGTSFVQTKKMMYLK